jgi:hypothetical protein
MTIDDELLEKARSAGARVAEMERQALLARADYHAAVRRLHLAGGSLREIADALRLSHQRVQQIVRGAGGSWWQRIWRTRNVKRDAVCTFCARPPAEVTKLIAGPDVYICDGCVAKAESALADAARPGGRAACSFCGKRPAAARPVFAGGDGAAVCRDCLLLCRQILDDRSR